MNGITGSAVLVTGGSSGLGAAVVSAGITTYLFIKRPERETGVELRLAPRVGMQESGLSLQGSF